jgi:hypothetical protein
MMTHKDLDELLVSYHSTLVIDAISLFFEKSPNDVLTADDVKYIKLKCWDDIKKKYNIVRNKNAIC